MIEVKLMGGLGNQMFQYAAARALALRTDGLVELDLSWFGMYSDRSFSLAPFAINAKIKNAHKNYITSNPFLWRVFRYLNIMHKFGGGKFFKESSFLYDSRINTLRSPVVLDGYFQSEKYFKDFSAQIRNEFTVTTPISSAANLILEKIKKSDAICIHIRRGDYVNNIKAFKYHGICSLDYYKSGLSAVIKGLKSPHCFIFSDDPEWVNFNFNCEISSTIVDIHGPSQAHEDLRLMSACQHFVIANSSFSWWGAWLSENVNKKVVAPLKWFGNSSIDTSDLIPADWYRI